MSTQTRGLIGIILIIIVILIYRKSRKDKKNKSIMIILIAFILVISSFRIENLFIRYNSPEAAFKNSGLRGNIVKTVDTANSTLVIYETTAASDLILYKQENKWVVPLFPKASKSIILKDGSFLMINRERNENNYYISVSVESNKYTVIDSKNTIFDEYKLSHNIMFESANDYVAYVEDVDENYYIEIDGQRFYVLQEVDF